MAYKAKPMAYKAKPIAYKFLVKYLIGLKSKKLNLFFYNFTIGTLLRNTSI